MSSSLQGLTRCMLLNIFREGEIFLKPANVLLALLLHVVPCFFAHKHLTNRKGRVSSVSQTLKDMSLMSVTKMHEVSNRNLNFVAYIFLSKHTYCCSGMFNSLVVLMATIKNYCWNICLKWGLLPRTYLFCSFDIQKNDSWKIDMIMLCNRKKVLIGSWYICSKTEEGCYF